MYPTCALSRAPPSRIRPPSEQAGCDMASVEATFWPSLQPSHGICHGPAFFADSGGIVAATLQ